MSGPGFTREDMRDAIADAISDSFDEDWTSAMGADSAMRQCGLWEVYEAGQRYMAAVKALFEIDPDTKDNYAVGSPTKCEETYQRFIRFNDTGKAFSAALAKARGEA